MTKFSSRFKNALVTGGAGFIGSHLSESLLKNNLNVTILDNLSTGRKENIPKRCNFVKGDILDYNLVKKILKEINIDIVYHLAARVTIRGSISNFFEDAQTNLMGTINLLQAVKDAKIVKKFIYASSMAVYADSPIARPLNENYKREPISPYGISKLASEKYILNICKNIDVQTVILRYFNTYGIRQTFTPYVGVVTIFINKLLKNTSPVIFGDGKQVRDFVSVTDVVEASMKAMFFDGTNEIFNIGSGKGTSINQIAKILSKRINSRVKPLYGQGQLGELKNSIADISKAKNILNYFPLKKLETGILEVIEYIK